MTGSLRPTHTNDAPSHPTARMKHQPSPPALLDGTGLLQMPLRRAQSPEAMQDNRSNWDHMRYTRSHKRQHEPNETPRHSATHTHLRGSSNAPLTALDPPISLPQTSAAIGVHFQPKPEAEGPTETKLSALRDSDPPSCPPFGVRQTKLSALRDSDPQVVRPSGFVRFLSCPPFGIQITKLSALRGSSDHQVVRPPGFRSPSCPPSGVCHCLRLPAQCGARCKQRCPSTSTARPLACMPTRKSLSDWRRLGGAATTNPRPQLPCVHQDTAVMGACVFINTRQLGAVRTLNPVQGVSARLLR